MEKMMISILNQIRHAFYPSRKTKQICAKNESSKPTKKTKLLNRWENDFINQKRSNSTKA
jgi:hypothetical protein